MTRPMSVYQTPRRRPLACIICCQRFSSLVDAPDVACAPYPMERAAAEALFVSQLDVIERVIASACGRHHVTAPDAQDFSSHVKLKLIDSDYAVLRKFQGRSSLHTYLKIVIERLFLDYRISAWGKWRPSAEARRAGPLGVLLEQLLTRDGHSFNEASQLMMSDHRVSVTRADLERIAATLPARAPRRFESDDGLAVIASGAPAADDLIEARRLSAALRRSLNHLNPQEQLILTLRFEDGRSVKEIAATLHLDQKKLYPRVESLLSRLRAMLEGDGIDASAAMRLVETTHGAE
jgi:RNA polymerase sigma factor (sigma-70 family)